MADYGKSRGLLDYISEDSQIRDLDKKHRGLFGLDPKVSGRKQPSIYRDVGGEMKSLFDDTMAMMPMGGVTALHASPYRFGRFSDEFNLKGEGANVYTRGHYLAENIKTAMEYLKDFATGKKFNYTKRAKDKYDPQIGKVDKAIWKTFSDLGHEENVTKIMDMKKKLSNLRLHKEYLEKR